MILGHVMASATSFGLSTARRSRGWPRWHARGHLHEDIDGQPGRLVMHEPDARHAQHIGISCGSTNMVVVPWE
jgi:hypothetical protein